MTSEELVNGLRVFLDRMSGPELERRLLRTASDLKDSVRDRVQNSGLNRRNQPFAAYTPPYAKQRQKAGFQVRKVDYTRTGRLWASIMPQVISNDGETIIIEIGPRGRENELKLLGPGTLKARKDGVRRGLPTLPNEKEISEAFAGFVEEIFLDFENAVK